MNISPSEPLWLDLQDVAEIHEEQIDLFGGPHGIRDAGLILGALGRPRNLFHLKGETDVLVLAVRLGVGIAAAHGFVDGNKRAGAVAMIEFLETNGYRLAMPNDTRLGRLFKLAVARRISEDDLTEVLGRYLYAWA